MLSDRTTPAAKYQPNVVDPFPGDDTPDLDAILKEVKQGCAAHERELVRHRELRDWYEGDSEKYVAFRPAEDALSWLTRPKRVSFVTRLAVDQLTLHLYKPGPRHRRITADREVDAWYNRVAQDLALNGVMREADRLAHLHGLCALGIYPTGIPARPINYHLFPRQDFVHWTSPDDPRVATALCTITRTAADVVRFRLWTKSHYYTFFRGKAWGYAPGGWQVARYDPGSSGPHPYGVLPFAFVTHKLPTTCLHTPGIGDLLVKVNRAVNVDLSNLAMWIHCYARPLGFVSGVGPEWRPKFLDGGFVPLVVRRDSSEDAPIVPEARYLESSLDINSIRDWIEGSANRALREIGVPLSMDMQQSVGHPARAATSGVAIMASDSDLIAYAKGRQPLFERHEQHLAALVCRIGACPAAGLPGLAAKLLAVAADPSLRVSWPEPTIDLPGQDRDNADLFELQTGLTDPIELIMRRQGLNEQEAVEQYRAIQRRKQVAAALDADPNATVDDMTYGVGSERAPDDYRDGDEREDTPTPDMGVDRGGMPTGQIQPPNAIAPQISATVAVTPDIPMPAAPLLLPATPGSGSWGTES